MNPEIKGYAGKVAKILGDSSLSNWDIWCKIEMLRQELVGE